ncbi:hypothetical protein MTO96_002004 [Rhipicephalus appendiculatus]
MIIYPRFVSGAQEVNQLFASSCSLRSCCLPCIAVVLLLRTHGYNELVQAAQSVNCASVRQVSLAFEQNLFINGNKALNMTVYLAAVIFYSFCCVCQKMENELPS